MNKKSIKSDLIKLDSMTDESINYSDISERGDEFFENAIASFPPPIGDLINKNEEGLQDLEI